MFDDTYSACSAPHILQGGNCNFVYQDEQEVTYMVPVPKGGSPKELTLTPIITMMIGQIQALQGWKKRAHGT